MLQKALGTSVILPEIGEPPFPVLHLLHGLSDDHTTWLRRTSLERYVEKLPLIVVLPDGSRGFYTNHHAGPSYAEHFAHELPAFIERNFPARSGREHRCVGGLSMGGYGALRLALGYPDRYVSATIHSGALMRGSRPPQQTRMGIGDELERIFGPSPKGSDHDLLRLAAIAKKSGRLPKLRLDCGAQDFLLEDNREFHRALEKLGVPHEYEEKRGGHDWAYWDAQVRKALRFHCRALEIAPAPNEKPRHP